MFEYNYNPRTHELYVNLPQNMKFDYDFHSDVAGLLFHALGNSESNEKIDTVIISCKQDADYDKMSKAYLFNVFLYLLLHRRVKWNRALQEQITSTVSIRDGAKFQEIRMGDELKKSNQPYYVFHGDKDVQKPVDEITKLLVEKNITLDEEEIKEFLSTTIGEIFSNSINHSNQDEVFFMFDIHYEKGDFYLCVNVIDYGTCITFMVKLYNDEIMRFDKEHQQIKSISLDDI